MSLFQWPYCVRVPDESPALIISCATKIVKRFSDGRGQKKSLLGKT